MGHNLIIWNEKRFGVNIPEIDKQHQMLISIINEFFGAFQEGNARSILEEILKQLSDYTVYHFKTEEKYLIKYDIPLLQEHLKEHQFFIKKVEEFKIAFFENRVTVSYELMNFLKKWLTEHIENKDIRDRKYFTNETINDN